MVQLPIQIGVPALAGLVLNCSGPPIGFGEIDACQIVQVGPDRVAGFELDFTLFHSAHHS